jgi:hypothetical protein
VKPDRDDVGHQCPASKTVVAGYHDGFFYRSMPSERGFDLTRLNPSLNGFTRRARRESLGCKGG